jgi:hypothetical protein
MKPLTQNNFDRSLQQLLTAEPSPNFVARVRTSVASQRTQAGMRGRLIVMAVSVTAAALLVVVAVKFSGPVLNETTASTLHRPQQVDTALMPDTVSASPAPEAAPRTRPRARGARAQRVRPEPWLQVMVAPDDLRALERLVRSTKDGTIALSFDETNQKLAIAELTIAPITTEPLVISEQQGVVQ